MVVCPKGSFNFISRFPHNLFAYWIIPCSLIYCFLASESLCIPLATHFSRPISAPPSLEVFPWHPSVSHFFIFYVPIIHYLHQGFSNFNVHMNHVEWDLSSVVLPAPKRCPCCWSARTPLLSSKVITFLISSTRKITMERRKVSYSHFWNYHRT